MPDTYVSGSGRHGSPPLSDKLVGVKTNLNDVVEQSQKGSQRECRYKDGGEAKLQNHFEVFVHQPVSVHRLQIPVFVPLWKLAFILYIQTSTTSFLHLPTRPPVLQQRITELHEVVPDLFEEHDDSHLQAQINQTAARVTLLQSPSIKEFIVFSRPASKPPEKESDVERGTVQIYKLEQEHLQSKAVLPLRLRPWVL